ncbi:4-hydroxyphenylacetate 3-hydroxylase family protein [Frankia sp. CcWB3]
MTLVTDSGRPGAVDDPGRPAGDHPAGATAEPPVDPPLGIPPPAAQGLITGERYRASLNDGREVWLDGEKVANVAAHPAFRGAVDELARLFDLQHEPDLRDVLTVHEPEAGTRVGWSYQLPRTLDDLRARRRSTAVWMRESWGQHGRSPSFMANVAVGLLDFRDHLERNQAGFGANAVAFYRHCAANDLVLGHALGDPQIDRTTSPVDDPDLALRIIAERDDGVVVRGAKQLTTLAPLAHEVLVYLSASFAQREAEQFVIWFGLPLATPGVKILCREPLGARPYGHAHTLASRFDEQDAMLFFDDVLVPWDRVFLLRDGNLARVGLGRINAWSAAAGHIRYQERLRTLLAVGTLLADAIGASGLRHVQEDLGELASYVDLVGYFLDAGEARVETTDGGLLAPGNTDASRVWSAQVAGRAVEIVRRIGSSGVLMQPSERDLAAADLRPYLDRYMRGANLPVEEKSRLFRLAWELTADSFGQRQDLYEFVHRGDITRNRINLLRRDDLGPVTDQIRELITRPL